MERSVELAGFFAAHAVWCIEDGETLVPMAAFDRSDGQRELLRFEADESQEAVRQGKEWLTANPEHASHAVLIYDALIPLPSGKVDCLMLEVQSYDSERESLSIAVPYRHAGDHRGFAVYRPKFILGRDQEEKSSDFGEAFFRGVAQHEKGAAVWNARLDESR